MSIPGDAQIGHGMKTYHDCIEATRAGAGSGDGNAYYDFHTTLFRLPDRNDPNVRSDRGVAHHEWTHWQQHSATTVGNFIFCLRHNTDGFVEMFWESCSCSPSQFRTVVMDRLAGRVPSLFSYEAELPRVRPELSARLGNYKPELVGGIGHHQLVDVAFIHYDPEAGISSQRLCEHVAGELSAMTVANWAPRPGYEELFFKLDSAFIDRLAERLHETHIMPMLHGELITLQGIFESVALVVEIVTARDQLADEVFTQRLHSLATSWYCAPLRAYCREMGLVLTPQTVWEQAETFLALCEVAVNPPLPPRVPMTLQGLPANEVFPAQRFITVLPAIRTVGALKLDAVPNASWLQVVRKYYAYVQTLAKAAQMSFDHRLNVQPLIPPPVTAHFDQMLFELLNGHITEAGTPDEVPEHWKGVSDWDLRKYVFDLTYAMLQRAGIGFVGDNALAFKTGFASDLVQRMNRVHRRLDTKQPLTAEEFTTVRNEMAWYPPARLDVSGEMDSTHIWPGLISQVFVMSTAKRFFKSDLLFSRAVPRMNALTHHIDEASLKIILGS